MKARGGHGAGFWSEVIRTQLVQSAASVSQNSAPAIPSPSLVEAQAHICLPPSPAAFGLLSTAMWRAVSLAEDAPTRTELVWRSRTSTRPPSRLSRYQRISRALKRIGDLYPGDFVKFPGFPFRLPKGRPMFFSGSQGPSLNFWPPPWGKTTLPPPWRPQRIF
ncbi:unnamed protein product [Trypanosoma congolense IL3000]|uniref:WGS project CAEQ00000000 data, annotated contig 2373 n=1 Tax=Trypanosoma congolense (strain IL3000) TaxID=1068625 RepID=F9WDK1_TRYCI|nr:unnamed protein product [Trypanosoma congolense IL3000]